MRRIPKSILSTILLLALLSLLFPAAPVLSAPTKNIIVYFPNWGTYNAAHNSMTVSMIPWDKITVVNHAFFEVDGSYKLASTDSFADFDKMFEHSEGWNPGQLRGHIGEYKYYKAKYPNAKIMISVGGWTRGQNFHAMASSSGNRAIFINSIVEFLKQYPFIDGIDLDWEYPGINRAADPNDQYDRGCPGGPEDKQNFTALIKEIRQAYNSNGLSGKMLTIAAPGGYDKVALQEPNLYYQYLDFINVMTYDMHGAWEKVTNHHSPIYANPNDPSPTSPVDIKSMYNTDAIMKHYVQKYGIPASKLNLGTPYYSRGWQGVNAATGSNGLYAQATGAAIGTWDNPQSPGGQYPYFKMKDLENTAGYVKYRDAYTKTPYLYNASQGLMFSYEDEQSLTARCDYLLQNGYGGMIVWEISGDNPYGFPMTTILYNKLSSGSNNYPPGAASISVDNPNNTGTYNVTVNVPAGNTATTMKLYEGSTAIVSQNITAPFSTTKNFTGKAAGTYTYRCDLTNAYGTTASSTITVTVSTTPPPNNKPDPAQISVDNPNNTGTYNVTVTVPAGNTATSMKLYEGSTAITSQNITAPFATNKNFTGKAAGTYTYRCDLANAYGTTASSTLTVTVSATPPPSSKYKCIGYIYGSPGNVEANKLTHVNYAFASIVNGQVSVATPGDLSKLVALKSVNPNLKVVLSIGGWGAEGFSDAALTDASRTTFANSCLKAINDNKIDGVDLDWEYPVNGGWGMIKGRPEDKQNFTLLLQKIREKIGSGKILSIASGAGQEYHDNTELDKIAQICDYINIMTYDFGASRHNANLYESSQYGYGLSCDIAVRNHISHGVPAAKINLGIPFYGRKGGEWPAYSDLVANYINKNGWVRSWDAQAKAAYLTKQGEFITYEDEQSIGDKVDYVKSKGLGGGMFWQYAHDPSGTLLTKLWTGLNGGSPPPPPPPNNKPDPAQISVDNANNTGNYTISVTIAGGNTAASMTLFENSTQVKSQSVSPGTSGQTLTYPVTSKPNGTYVYRCDLTNAYGTTPSSNLTVTVSSTPPPPPPDKAKGKPGTPAIYHDNWDGDGNYTIEMDMWWGNNGTNYTLFENGSIAKSGTLVDNTPNWQTVKVPISGRANGTYSYKFDLTNYYGTTSSMTITVNVTKGDTPPPPPNNKPDPAQISVDKANNTGSYTITAAIGTGNTATSMKLYEGSTIVKSQNLTPGSAVQTITYPVTGKPAGTYIYRCDLTNSAGTTSSTNLTVTVSTTPPPPANEWQPYTIYGVGMTVTYQGKTYKCRQSHYTLPGWEPPLTPALWEPI
ncbi:MAG: glycosyl hydrolase family 18 protein [Acidobacteriota bacterium]